jgi:peptidoglycan/xylan/chitin deacetylase (PgdA/CDA1 family)
MPVHILRRAIRRQLASTGVFDRIIHRRTFGGVLVLCYHAIRRDEEPDGSMPFEGLHVRQSLFREHCQILSRLCHPVSLARWRDALCDNQPLPPRPVLITFDDGYRSVLTEALPVLEKFSMPAAIFACSDPIARSEMFWYDAVASSQGETAVSRLKAAPYAEWRSAFERARQPVAPNAPTAPLRPRDIETLAAHPLIEVGGHTHRHPILSRGDEGTQREEISENLQALQQWTGKRPIAFAYPNGRRGHDYTPGTESFVSHAGIALAFGTDEAIATRAAAALGLPRFTITAGMTAAHLVHRLAWVWR